jgi:hypothetical protein
VTTLDDTPLPELQLDEVQAKRIEALVDLLEREMDTTSMLSESLADAQLAMEDAGWERILGQYRREFTREGLRRAAELCRVHAVVNPMARRALAIRAAYVWGQGCSITARATGEKDAQQDVNGVVQEFITDPSNAAAFFSALAREENERVLGTDGNFGLLLFTSPLSGKVQARSVPFDELQDIFYNPDDRDDPWFYLREWVTEELQPTSAVIGGPATGTAKVQVNQSAYYPAVGFYPKVRPRAINGIAVQWDSPLLALPVNRLDGWKFGIGDLYAALPWLRGYKEFLDDWRILVKSLSKYAWKSVVPPRGKAQARERLSAAPTLNPVTHQPNDVGATALLSPNAGLEAVPKTGATIDSNSGRPLAAMAAAGVDLPVTMLLGDPGVTGARATAETLDKPTELTLKQRQQVWADFIRRLLNYVVDQAVIAPAGPLKGTTSRDPQTGALVVELAGDTDRTVDITFPELEDVPLELIVQAIVAADATSKMPPLLTIKLLLEAFGVSDIDEWLEKVTDPETGEWMGPPLTTAGQAAIDAFRNGTDQASLDTYTGGSKPAADEPPVPPEPQAS